MNRKFADNFALPAATALQSMFELFETEVLDTDRKLLLRVVLAEGPKFPPVAELHDREEVAPGLAMVGGLPERAAWRGDLSASSDRRHPELVMAPVLLAVIWDGLFSRLAPPGIGAMFRVQGRMQFGKTAMGTK